MQMENTFLSLFIFFLGMATGLFLIQLLAKIHIQRIETKIESLSLQQAKVIPLNIESHDKQFFCYNAETQDFVCQGNSIAEIVNKFESRFPNSVGMFVTKDHDPEFRAWIKSEVAKLK